MKQRGFTLLELMITMGLLSFIGFLGFVAMRSSAVTMSVSDAKTTAQANVRDVIMVLANELQFGPKASTSAGNPSVHPIDITNGPTPDVGSEITFQVPLDVTGRKWSNPIQYRFMNEDADGNGQLGPGEDTDGDGVLTRCILRIEDRNGDGDVADSGEMRRIAAANDVSSLQFELVGDVVTITVTSTCAIKMGGGHVTTRITRQVYLMN